MIDPGIVNHLAQRFSLPPPMVSAMQDHPVPKGLLDTYGLDEMQARSSPEAVLTIMAHAVSESFSQHHSLQMALSHVLAGDPNAFRSPTSHVGGQITALMAKAALAPWHSPDSYTPASGPQFSAAAKDFANFLAESRDLGGSVSDQTLQVWRHQIERFKPSPQSTAPTHQVRTSGPIPQAPMPEGPTPKDVEEFAKEMAGRGIDVDHFLQHFPLVSSLRYKMMNAKTTLSDYAPMSGLQASDILTHVRSQPHPTYPNITAGQFADMHDLAHLHSLPSTMKPPEPSVVARLVASGAKWNEVKDYYSAPH